MPTYAGGLGLLAGDMIRAAADLKVPMIAVTLLQWIEGCIEGVTGWAIGEDGKSSSSHQTSATDAASLYDKLERIIAPMFYHARESFLAVMLHAIALNGSFFNAHRMIKQYMLNAYAHQPGSLSVP